MVERVSEVEVEMESREGENCKGSKSKIKCQEMGIFINIGGKGQIDYWKFLDS